MTTAAAAGRRLWLIDDDELSRAILALVAGDAGFETESFSSGDEALHSLASSTKPFAILTDMQMPGITGNALGAALRESCGPATVLLAMSGTAVSPEKTAEFDGFLLKPFSAETLRAAIEKAPVRVQVANAGSAGILNDAVYENFAKSMPATSVAGLYKMCLDDAHKRLETMRRAAAAGDDAEYKRAAHAIKGSCGMVGALELATLAADMEREGLPGVTGDGPKEAPLDQFVAASARLGRMLDAKVLERRLPSAASDV